MYHRNWDPWCVALFWLFLDLFISGSLTGQNCSLQSLNHIIYINVYIHIYMYMYICICMCIYIYTRKYIHVYIYTIVYIRFYSCCPVCDYNMCFFLRHWSWQLYRFQVATRPNGRRRGLNGEFCSKATRTKWNDRYILNIVLVIVGPQHGAASMNQLLSNCMSCKGGDQSCF